MANYSFAQLSDGFLQSKELRGQGNRLVVLSILSNFMRLSCSKKKKKKVNPDQFYDDDEGDYFIFYTQKRMLKTFGTTLKTIGTIYDDLENNGFIKRIKLGNHHPDKIFLTPKTKKLLPKQEKTSGSDLKNLTPSNSEENKNDVRHRDSDHSSNDSINAGKRTKNDQSSQPDRTDQENTSNAKTSMNKQLINWIKGVHNGLGLDNSVIQNVLRVVHNDIPTAHHLIGLIRNAKAHIAKVLHLSPKDARTRFEKNVNLKAPLADKILNIYNYAKDKAQDTEERGKYFSACLNNFFKDAFGFAKRQEQQEQVRPSMKEETYTNDDGDQIYISDDGYDIHTNSFNDHKGQNGPTIPIFKIK